MYAVGHALSIVDIFAKMKTSRLKTSSKTISKIMKGNERHRMRLAMRIFLASVKLIVDDIIDNGITFQLPTKSRKCELYMKRYCNDEFISLRQVGKF
jgi:hypoxanthine-guanine phosphoribosyltransferase